MASVHPLPVNAAPAPSGDRLEQALARIKARYDLVDGSGYTIDDLAKIPPCPVCGARAGIVDGRLAFATCNPAKHRPAAPAEPTPAKTPPVQRDFGLDTGVEEWWHR